MKAHPYHLVDPSPWPLTTSISLLIITLSTVLLFQGYNTINIYIGLISLIFSLFFWFKDIVIESTFLGFHSKKVRKGISIGFWLFLISEIFFFISIFWAFFHSSLSPTATIGNIWPPVGIEAINPWGLPLLNTIILLSAGVTITVAHHSLINNNKKLTVNFLYLTVLLCIIFTYFQGFEYYYGPFNISDGIFGSVFYFSTGMHGLHVIIGTIFITISLIRIIYNHTLDSNHNGFLFAILYFHLVDYIWLLLFGIVYWWGS